MKEPHQKSTSQYIYDEIDSIFWHSPEIFHSFFERLWGNCFAPIRNSETVNRDIRQQGEKTERLYLFIKDQNKLNLLLDKFETPKLFFFNLENLYLCDLIDEIRIKVKKTDGSFVTFTQLSEGEQQLLSVLGLLIFTQGDESLFLLDEPNTHLNPVWTYEYIDLLKSCITTENNQIVVTSHDPLMISSLYKNQVRIVDIRDNESISAFEPEYDPIGIGIEGLLQSELYGLRSTLSPMILEKLTTQYQLLGKQQLSESEQNQLMKISIELNSLGVSYTHPNPYFMEFASAMAKLYPQSEIPQSKERITAQEEIGKQMLQEIILQREKEKSEGK